MPREADSQADNAPGGLVARLQHATHEKRWKQADLARESGLDRKRISEYWRGRQQPSRDSLIALAKALGVDPRWLAGGVNASTEALLNEIDAAIEAGDDARVLARRGDLAALVGDPDLSPSLQNRANYLLGLMGDQGARQEHHAATAQLARSRDDARRAVEKALDSFAAERGVDLGEGVRQAISGLCSHLLIVGLENASAEVLEWPVHELCRAIASRTGAEK